MKLFHLSDLHLGIKLYNYDLKEDQQHILRQIVQYAKDEKPDAILLAGDIYDRSVPAAEAMSLLDNFVIALKQAVPDTVVLAIAGNHDNPQRIEYLGALLRQQGVHMVGFPPQAENDAVYQVTLQDAYGPVHFYLLPFIRTLLPAGESGEDRLCYQEAVETVLRGMSLTAEERNVLVSHQFYVPGELTAESMERMESETYTVGNVDQVRADWLATFDYCALGHIHKPTLVLGEHCRYSGTPMPYSVSEAGQQKGIVVAELRGKGELKTRILPLTPLRRVRCITGTLSEVLACSCEDYVRADIALDAPLSSDERDRVRHAFPYLLEIRPQTAGHEQPRRMSHMVTDPMELCLAFWPELDGEDRKMLLEIVQEIQEKSE